MACACCASAREAEPDSSGGRRRSNLSSTSTFAPGTSGFCTRSSICAPMRAESATLVTRTSAAAVALAGITLRLVPACAIRGRALLRQHGLVAVDQHGELAVFLEVQLLQHGDRVQDHRDALLVIGDAQAVGLVAFRAEGLLGEHADG